jgi:predicted Zn-dependent protease
MLVRSFRLVLVAVLTLAHSSLASADTIVLRNGQELRGRVTIEGEKARIELDVGGTVVVAKGEIASTKVEGGAGATGEAAAVSAELLARLETREKTHVLLEALADEKDSVRQKAEEQLAQAGREALPMVRSAFGSGTASQRRHLLRVLAAIGDPASVPKIIEILRDAKEKELHVEAARALAAITGYEAVPVLTELLVSSKDTEVRTECLKAVAELRAPFAAPFVLEALRDPLLRPAARAATAAWRDPVLLPYVLPMLDGGSDEAQAATAAWFVALMTPAHVATYSRLLDVYDGDKHIAKALLPAGAQHLHKEFPVVGDVELLNATQQKVKDFAYANLQKIQKDRRRRGPTPADWRDERDQATEPRILLAPVGAINLALVRALAEDLAGSLKTATAAVKVEVGRKAFATPPGPEGRPRDARRLLTQLEVGTLDEPQAARVLGVTFAELAVPGQDAALAPTRRGGAGAVSLARLGKGDDASRRANRLLLHALAMSLDLPPCGDATCPSSPFYAVPDLDARSPRYCAACRAAFVAAWDAERDAAAFSYAGAAQKLAGLAAKSKLKETQAAAACWYERALQPLAAIEAWKAYQAMESDQAIGAVITRRIEMLDRAEKWLTKKKAAPPPPGQPRPRRQP